MKVSLLTSYNTIRRLMLFAYQKLILILRKTLNEFEHTSLWYDHPSNIKPTLNVKEFAFIKKNRQH